MKEVSYRNSNMKHKWKRAVSILQNQHTYQVSIIEYKIQYQSRKLEFNTVVNVLLTTEGCVINDTLTTC